MTGHSHEPADKGYVRQQVMVVATLLAIALAAGMFIIQIRATDDARATCERANLARTAQLRLLNDLVTVNEGRVEALQGAGDPQTTASNRYALRQYRKDRSAYKEAQSVAALNPFGPGPNSVRVDCEEVNPYPWPL